MFRQYGTAMDSMEQQYSTMRTAYRRGVAIAKKALSVDHADHYYFNEVLNDALQQLSNTTEGEGFKMGWQAELHRAHSPWLSPTVEGTDGCTMEDLVNHA